MGEARENLGIQMTIVALYQRQPPASATVYTSDSLLSSATHDSSALHLRACERSGALAGQQTGYPSSAGSPTTRIWRPLGQLSPFPSTRAPVHVRPRQMSQT